MADRDIDFGPLARFAVEVITQREGSTWPWRGTDQATAWSVFDAALLQPKTRRARVWLVGGPDAPRMLDDRNLESRAVRP